jgi:hypothetical protein
MLFIFPMWESENQRLGFRACMSAGYVLRSLADLLGLIGLISLVGAVLYLVCSFSWRACWFLMIPVGAGISAQAIFTLAEWCAARKRFCYDYETRTARWIEDGYERQFPTT